MSAPDLSVQRRADAGAPAPPRAARRLPRFGIGRRTLVGALSLLGLLVLWWVLTTGTGLVAPYRFPSPAEFRGALDQFVTDGYAGGTLWVQAWHSTRLVLMGFAVAVVTGVPLGLLMGVSPRAEALLNPAFLLVRPIPPLAWIPLAIVWLGLGDAAKVLVIWFAAFVPSVINTWTGVRGVDRTLIAAARVHGAGSRRLLTEVIIPGALPMIFTGLRLSLQASWTTLVAAELVGAFFGLGRVLDAAYRDINPAMITVAMVAVGILGAATTRLLGEAERRLIPWRS
ncbi:ABC transporter permease [Falsiroseomonas bella]|uniref:ABC transporter permease n=1 Tax=Falsiroseomonas bella TaxID=2184016 RepID=A0A317F917_9PROT|nr:ABC transporter permease [Falsiroseomonas bella]PWS34507.1 ABC transporter permease [Falsiroseomonas bella]